MDKEEKFQYYKERLRESENAYATTSKEIEDNKEAYFGTRKIKRPGNSSKCDNKSVKGATNVRRVVYELIESQIDSNIPLPKVTARKRVDEDNAKAIEYMLKNEIDRLPFEAINDEQERVCPISGSSIFLVEWDNSQKTHNTLGELNVKLIDTNAFIPQKGVKNINEMDYIFIKMQQSKELIYKKYGVRVKEDENEKEADNKEVVTHIFCYYKNSKGNVCLISWVGEQIIQDIEDYQFRKKQICTSCGKDKEIDSDICTNCGNKAFKTVNNNREMIDITVMQGEVSVKKTIEVDYYIPNVFPIVMRKNVSQPDRVLGGSDAEAIKDQQNDINIFSTKIREKMLKPGSIVLLSEGMNFEATDEELKIVRKRKPNDNITTHNLEADITADMNYRENEYQTARQTLGITDSFQGRKDPTATSGKAKEISISQSAGRLESKKTMKAFCYSELYKLMFKFLLAYADEPRIYLYKDAKGESNYHFFDKRNFLRIDEAGEYYYEDQYLFSVDTSSNLSNNREAMWQETRLNFQQGAYGSQQDIETLIIFWTIMDYLHYPGAKQAITLLQERQKRQQVEQVSIQQAQMINGGGGING